MSALTNDPFTLARYAGLYKALQSAGAAGSFGMDAVATTFLNEHLASWSMLLLSFPLAYIVLRTIKETNYEDEKVVYVDDVKPDDAEHGIPPYSKSDSINNNVVEVTEERVDVVNRIRMSEHEVDDY